jgi:FAD/FMN-containing dehydrogenase
LSGIKATIGGGLSQNSIFWGSGQFGSAVDSVISLDVVLADGSLVTTGSGAQINSSPFSVTSVQILPVFLPVTQAL